MINSKEIEYAQALAELSYILKNTDKELVRKIPTKFLEHMEEKKDINYTVNIDVNIPLEKQNLNEKTKNLIAIIYRNYFCLPEEKKEYDKILIENQEKYNNELNEKYSYNKIFNQDQTKINEDAQEKIPENNVYLIDYENMKWYGKVIFKVKNWIKVVIENTKIIKPK